MAFSNDINGLIYRYMSENGFTHSAFLFQAESKVNIMDPIDSQIPSNALVTILQKALLFNRLEKVVRNANHDINHPLHNSLKELESTFPENKNDTYILTILEKMRNNLNGNRDVVILSDENATLLKGHKMPVYACDWNNTGDLFVTGSGDGTTIIWKIKSGKLIEKQVINSLNDSQSGNGISSIDWESNGRYFATGSFDSNVGIYDANGELIGVLKNHKKDVFAIKFNRAGNLLLSWSADKTIVLWDVEKLCIKNVFEHHSNAILDACWKDEQNFAVASADCKISICSCDGDFKILEGHEGHVTVISWNCDSTLLASGSEDNTIRIWKEDSCSILSGHKSGITCLKWSIEDPNLIISSSHSGDILIHNAETCEIVQHFKFHNDEVISLSLSPDNSFLASGGCDGTIVITDIRNGQRFKTFKRNSPLCEIKWDPSGMYLAACFEDSNAAIISVFEQY